MKASHSRAFPPSRSIIRMEKMFPGKFDAAMMKPSAYTVRGGRDTGRLKKDLHTLVFYSSLFCFCGLEFIPAGSGMEHKTLYFYKSDEITKSFVCKKKKNLSDLIDRSSFLLFFLMSLLF